MATSLLLDLPAQLLTEILTFLLPTLTRCEPITREKALFCEHGTLDHRELFYTLPCLCKRMQRHMYETPQLFATTLTPSWRSTQQQQPNYDFAITRALHSTQGALRHPIKTEKLDTWRGSPKAVRPLLTLFSPRQSGLPGGRTLGTRSGRLDESSQPAGPNGTEAEGPASSSSSTSAVAAPHLSLVIGCSPRLRDADLSHLVTRQLHGDVTRALVCVDVRACPGLTAQGIVTLLQACPALETIDAGECEGLSLLRLSSLLKKATPLVATRLGHVEVSGSGRGDTWVGYRQQWAFHHTAYTTMVTRGYLHYSYTTSADHAHHRDCIPAVEGGPTEADKASSVFRHVGGHPLLVPAIRAIEASIRAQQGSEPIFTLGVNTCGRCHVALAEYAPWDGQGHGGHEGRPMQTREEKLRYLRDYGRHTCQGCGRSALLCLPCLRTEFRYCADPACTACFCTDCDNGGRSAGRSPVPQGQKEELSPKGVALSPNGAGQAVASRHFRVVNCQMGRQCAWPADAWGPLLICHTHEAALGPNSAGDVASTKVCGAEGKVCDTCDGWQCHFCAAAYGVKCQKCRSSACLSCHVDRCSECGVCCSRCYPLKPCEVCATFYGDEGQLCQALHCNECFAMLHDDEGSLSGSIDQEGQFVARPPKEGYATGPG